MKKIYSILIVIMITIVLMTKVEAVSYDKLSVSTNNNIVEQSVEYNENLSNNEVKENNMQDDAEKIYSKEEKLEMFFVLGGVLVTFTVAAIYEINHD